MKPQLSQVLLTQIREWMPQVEVAFQDQHQPDLFSCAYLHYLV